MLSRKALMKKRGAVAAAHDVANKGGRSSLDLDTSEETRDTVGTDGSGGSSFIEGAQSSLMRLGTGPYRTPRFRMYPPLVS